MLVILLASALRSLHNLIRLGFMIVVFKSQLSSHNHVLMRYVIIVSVSVLRWIQGVSHLILSEVYYVA